MFLTNWHFCAALQLSPKETSIFLDVMNCLENDQRSPELVGLAISSLAAADVRLQVYAIPELVRGLRHWTEPRLRREAANLITSGPAPGIAANLLTQLRGMGLAELSELIRSVSEAASRPGRASDTTTNLVTGGVHVLALALVREAARTAGGAAQVEESEDDQAYVDALLRGEDRPWLVDDARTGRLGRIPRLLVAESFMLADEPVDVVLRDLDLVAPGPWLGEPDLVRLRLLLALEERRLNDATARADWLAEEAVVPRLLSEQGVAALQHAEQGDRYRPNLSWLRLRTREQPTATLVLWQAVAWALAVAESPVASAAKLSEVWTAPEDFTGKRGTLTLRVPGSSSYLHQPLEYLLRLRDQGPSGLRIHEDPRPNATGMTAFLHSPWLDRKRAEYRPNDNADANHAGPPATFGSIDDNVAMLRILGNTGTLVELLEALLRADLDVPLCFWDLLNNLLDVLGNSRLRDTIRHLSESAAVPTAGLPLSPVVLGLTVPAKKWVDRLSKGELHPGVPASLYRSLMLAEERGDARSRQLRYLYLQAASMAVSHVAWESLSGEIRPYGERGSWSPWFAGGEDSPAAMVSRLILDRVWRRIEEPERYIQEPAALAKSAFPNVLADSGRVWQWLDAYTKTPRRSSIGFRLVLLSNSLPFEQWRELDPLDPDRFGKGLLAAFTQRLETLVAESAVEADDPWYVSWRERIDRINLPRFLSGDMRTALARLLSHSPANDVAADIQRRALHAILEFSSDALRYQDLAAGVLHSQAGAATGNPFELSKDWLYTVALQVHLPGTRFESPWQLSAELRGNRQRREILEHFVVECLLLGQDATALAEVLERVARTGAPPNLDTTHAPVSSHRLLSVRRQRDSQWAIATPAPAGPLSNAFEDGRNPAIKRLGLVAGHRTDNYRVLLNIGEAEPRLGPPLALALADQVAVQLEPLQVTSAPPPAVRIGERRPASVSWDGTELMIHPDSRSAGPIPRSEGDLIHRWLPDISAVIGAPHRADRLVQCIAPQRWAPVEGDFMRLLLDHFGNASSSPRTFVVVEDLTDEPGWVLATGIGEVYAIPASKFEPGLVEALRAWMPDPDNAADRAGLLLTVTLAYQEGRPYLAASQESAHLQITAPLDDRNVRWRTQFSDAEPRRARKLGDTWVVDSAVPEMRDSIALDFDRDRVPPGASEASVRIAASDWDPMAQRRARVRARFIGDVETNLDDGPTGRATHRPKTPSRAGVAQSRSVAVAEPMPLRAVGDEWRVQFKEWQSSSRWPRTRRDRVRPDERGAPAWLGRPKRPDADRFTPTRDRSARHWGAAVGARPAVRSSRCASKAELPGRPVARVLLQRDTAHAGPVRSRRPRLREDSKLQHVVRRPNARREVPLRMGIWLDGRGVPRGADLRARPHLPVLRGRRQQAEPRPWLWRRPAAAVAHRSRSVAGRGSRLRRCQAAHAARRDGEDRVERGRSYVGQRGRRTDADPLDGRTRWSLSGRHLRTALQRPLSPG